VARTPLFRALRRSMRLAQSTLVTGHSPAEAVGRFREGVASRRAFLQASAAAATGVALGACATRAPHAAAPRSTDEVVIVGAGIAGLVAGYRLQQAGVPVRIFEAQNRTGGRMFSLRDHFPDGQVVELGGELIDTGHAHIRALCGELGITLDDLDREEDGIARQTWFFGGQRRTEEEVVEAFRPIAARVQAELDTLSGDRSVTYREPNGGAALDVLSLEQWLDRAGVTGWMRSLLQIGYTTEYGLEADRQSALNFLLMIDPQPDPFRIYADSDERFHVRGGNDLVVGALADALRTRIETNSVLEALGESSDGRFRLTFRRGATSRVVDAPHVVLALPFTLLRQVRLSLDLPAVKHKAIAELGYGTNAKLMVGFSERTWRTTHRTNGSVSTDLSFQSTWETSRHQPGRSGVLTNFTGGKHGVELGRGAAREQADRLARELDTIFPGSAAAREGAREVRFHWPSFPWTLGSYASYLLGQRTAFGGEEGRPVGRLHFAGEHCSRDAQGFMEGGCETGEAAAKAILRQIGLPRAALRKAS
jgi:monoamine oxidase